MSSLKFFYNLYFYVHWKSCINVLGFMSAILIFDWISVWEINKVKWEIRHVLTVFNIRKVVAEKAIYY